MLILVLDLKLIKGRKTFNWSKYAFVLGRNRKLRLSGRKSRDVGILCTSKLYSLQDRIFAFTPQVCVRILATLCQKNAGSAYKKAWKII